MKNLFKIYFFLISPLWIILWLLARISIYHWFFYYMAIFVSKIPFVFWDITRYWFYKMTLRSLWENVQFMYGSIVQNRHTKIGHDVVIWLNSIIWLSNIWNYVLFGVAVQIIPGGKNHGFEDISVPMMYQKWEDKKVIIEDDCWLWSGAIVMSDISKWSIVWSGSVVTKKYEGYSILWWNPARVIRKRF